MYRRMQKCTLRRQGCFTLRSAVVAVKIISRSTSIGAVRSRAWKRRKYRQLRLTALEGWGDAASKRAFSVPSQHQSSVPMMDCAALVPLALGSELSDINHRIWLYYAADGLGSPRPTAPAC
jgi:hypothetical protein